VSTTWLLAVTQSPCMRDHGTQMTSISSFHVVRPTPSKYGNQQAFFICKADLIESKEAAAPPKDQEDLRVLRLGDVGSVE
jgi:hypothetical protein